VDGTAFEQGLLVTSTHPQADSFAGDQVLLAPAYTSTDEELAEMVERFGATMTEVERRVGAALVGSSS
jgi:adenosylmethionine-8-amino-7-oxononanoate aminotransferase